MPADGRADSVRLMEEFARRAAQAAMDRQQEEDEAERKRIRLGEDPRCGPLLPMCTFWIGVQSA